MWTFSLMRSAVSFPYPSVFVTALLDLQAIDGTWGTSPMFLLVHQYRLPILDTRPPLFSNGTHRQKYIKQKSFFTFEH